MQKFIISDWKWFLSDLVIDNLIKPEKSHTCNAVLQGVHELISLIRTLNVRKKS